MTKKKTKYKSITVGKKKYHLYSIHWYDIVGDSGHASEEEFEKMNCAKMITHGYIFKKNKKFIWVFSTYDENEASFSDRNIIPMGCVIKLNKIPL